MNRPSNLPDSLSHGLSSNPARSPPCGSSPSLSGGGRVRRQSRWAACIIGVAIALLAGHLGRVQSPQGRTPFLSANDRSRWATVRALLEHGTYELDKVSFTTPLPEDDGGLKPPRAKRDTEWHSIDMVRHRGADGREHFYSSKPPLLATLVAGVCGVVEWATGARLVDNPKYVGRLTLVFVNLLPLAAAWWLLARMLMVESRTREGRLFVLVAAAFGTLLGPMAVTLNNHIPAAVATQVAVFAVWRLLRGKQMGTKLSMAAWCAVAGGAAALATAFELPALSLLAVLGLVVGRTAPLGLFIGFLPAAAMVAAVAFGLNFAAHGEWRPAYANRADGAVVAKIAETPWDASVRGSARVSPELRATLASAGIEVSERATHRPATATASGAARWTLWDPESHRRWAVIAAENGLECREWRNWYDYEGSYWTPDRLRGVDRGEPSRWAYLFHATFGHHGVFSVTPIWLLSLAGGWLAWRKGSGQIRLWVAIAGLLTVVCLTFYVARPLIDRNYGGVSCGFRWLFWLIPLWCLPMASAADAALRARWGRLAAVALLAASVFSAAWSATKPWSHPWIYEYWASLGWIVEG
jgi:hypothetical protein